LVPGSGADDAEFERVNVSGTRNVCEASVEAGVSRMLFVSTVHSFGIHPGEKVDETTIPSKPFHTGYDASKARAEEVVLEFASTTLDAVVINPTVVFGPRSRHSGRLISMFLRGRLPAIPLPGRQLSLVYSGDVARGARLALENGKRGERYILANPGVTIREFVQELAGVSGRSAPRLSVPGWLAAAGIAVLWGLSPMTRWKPPVTVAGIRHGGTIYDGGRANSELHLDYTSLEDALADTVEWMRRDASTDG
jgi:nucleoside-diphosphate-sugar epimerase